METCSTSRFILSSAFFIVLRTDIIIPVSFQSSSVSSFFLQTKRYTRIAAIIITATIAMTIPTIPPVDKA